MSKIGNHRIELQERDDYQFGWESAERGKPYPTWDVGSDPKLADRLTAQALGWCDFRNHEAAL